MDEDRWTIDNKDRENEDGDYVFRHDEAIEEYLQNPDAVIVDFAGHRYIFRVKQGYIGDRNIADIEKVIRNTAIDYEYPLLGMDVTSERIEVRVEISVHETPLESSERFQERLERSGIITELLYIGTLSKKQPDQ